MKVLAQKIKCGDLIEEVPVTKVLIFPDGLVIVRRRGISLPLRLEIGEEIEITRKKATKAEKARRSKRGRSGKRKGATWERRWNQALRAIFDPSQIVRGDQRWRGGAAPNEGADSEGTPWWQELKHAHVISVWAPLRQARQKQAEKGDMRPRMVVAKIDKPPPEWRVGLPKEPVVCALEAPDMLDLLWDWVRLRKLAGEPIEAPKSGIDWNSYLRPKPKKKVRASVEKC